MHLMTLVRGSGLDQYAVYVALAALLISSQPFWRLALRYSKGIDDIMCGIFATFSAEKLSNDEESSSTP